MFGRKLTLGNELYQRMKKCSETAGYATPEEFALHVLEKEVDRVLFGAGKGSTETDAEIVKEGLEESGSIE